MTVRRRTSKRAIASAERRDEILDAAVEAFTEAGFNGTSMRCVAARVGMSTDPGDEVVFAWRSFESP